MTKAIDASTKGRLLVASPALTDPNFDGTVVYMLDHDDDGALGLVLNRPGATSVAEVLPGWETVTSEPGCVFLGGPVADDAAICLAQLRPGAALAGWTAMVETERLGTYGLDGEPDDVAGAVAGMRIYVGYAGWGPGQLEGEIDLGAWFVVDARPDDVFCDAPGTLWRGVLRRQRGSLAFVHTWPADPAHN